MKKNRMRPAVLAGALGLMTLPLFAAEPEVAAPEVVAAIEGAFGVVPGERRNHIKGACAVGEFVGSKDAARYTRSPLFSGKPDPEKMKAFKASHPDNLAQAEYLASNNPPASYANSAYWGIHSFKFIDRKNRATLVRWRFVPQDGEQRLGDEALKTAGAHFLEQALIERAQQGPARWDMLVTIGQPGDPETDPTRT